MQNLANLLLEELRQGKSAVVATIVSASGPLAPPVGTKLLIREDGISSGTLESLLLRNVLRDMALEALNRHSSSLQIFNLDSLESEFIRKHSSTALIYVQFFAANAVGTRQFLEELAALSSLGTPAWLILDLSTAAAWRPYLYAPGQALPQGLQDRQVTLLDTTSLTPAQVEERLLARQTALLNSNQTLAANDLTGTDTAATNTAGSGAANKTVAAVGPLLLLEAQPGFFTKEQLQFYIEPLWKSAPTAGDLRIPLETLLCQLFKTEAALVVTNPAAGLLLACTTLARHKQVLLARQELRTSDLGQSLPALLEQGDTTLLTVGTATKSRLRDYQNAVTAGTVGALLKIPVYNYLPDDLLNNVSRETEAASNNRATNKSASPGSVSLEECAFKNGVSLEEYTFKDGASPEEYTFKDGVSLEEHTFKDDVSLEELTAYGHQVQLPVLYDLGSSPLFAEGSSTVHVAATTPKAAFIDSATNISLPTMALPAKATLPAAKTPLARQRLFAMVAKAADMGVDLLFCRGDQLLDGPQCCIILGRKAFINQLSTNPLLQALCPDKLVRIALEAALQTYLAQE